MRLTDSSAFDDADWERLARYFAGECASDESAEIAAWVAADPARATRVAGLRRMWESSGDLATVPAAENWNVADLWRRQAARLDRIDHQEHVRQAWNWATAFRGARRTPAHSTIAIAASLVIAVGLAVGLRRIVWPLARMGAGALAPKEIATGRGQRAHVLLSDGTQVELSADSHLSVPLVRGSHRDVYLDGEALFAVIHDPSHPFRVHAGGVVTEDIGTRFDVRAYAGDRATRVVVAEGRVGVMAAGKGAVRERPLRAGDVATVADTAVAVVHGVDPAPYLMWTDGRLAFDHVSLAQVAVDLGRWFDVNVEIADSSVATRQLTATFAVESLQDVLDAITIPLGVRYERHGRDIVLRRRG